MQNSTIVICKCGQRTTITKYEDGHQDRNRPKHCDICHDKDYDTVYFVCKDCETQILVLEDEIELDGKSYIDEEKSLESN